jgi:hypothetical protein
MPTWLFEKGFRFGIVAGDCVEPPHVHIRGHGGAAKVWLAPVEVALVRGYNRRQLAVIQRTVEAHLVDFLERWYGFCL